MELKIQEIENIPENTGLKSTGLKSTGLKSNGLKNTVKPKISYDDILSKMGMFVSNGELHLMEKDDYIKYQQQQQQQPQRMDPISQNPHQNNYIYNKYFKDVNQMQPTVRRPRTLQEYKRMLVEDYIQTQKIKQIKSTKLIMPTTNIHISPQKNPNKLFYFKNN